MLSFLKAAVDDASADQRPKVIAIYVLLLTANAAVWTWAIIAFAGRPTLLGTAFLAYVLGLRHAVDADHIAAIDNVVRKLMQEGKRPVSVGLFFSLGHSLVVTISVAVIVGLAFALEGRLHPFKVIGSIIGTGASAFFLLAIAAINLVILRAVWGSFRRARRGEAVADHELDLLLSGRGFLARIFRPLFRMVSRSWQMFPIGFLFGLGFDTATEITLFTVAATQASGGMSLGTVMLFPALIHRGHDADRYHRQRADGRRLWLGIPQSDPQDLVQSHHHCDFRAGCLFDRRHRGAWPDRRQARSRRHFWGAVGDLNDGLANFGYLVIGVFIGSWIISYLIYRWQGFDRPAVERIEVVQ